MKLQSIVSTLTQLEDPLPAFNFFVSLDPTDAHLPAAQAALIPVMALGAFAEVKGLDYSDGHKMTLRIYKAPANAPPAPGEGQGGGP